MTLSLENKQGGKLKRWSLTTALWPRDGEAMATCEQRCNVPLGMCCSVSVCAHAPVCVSVIPQLECDCLVPECVPLCVLVSASYSNNDNLRAKWKHCNKRILVGTSLFLSYLHFAARCQNKCSTYQCQGNAETVSVNVWLTNSLIWMWHTPPVGTVLPEAAAVTPCSDSHFTSQPRPWSWGLPGAYTPNPALGPRALFWELKSHNCRADSDS